MLYRQNAEKTLFDNYLTTTNRNMDFLRFIWTDLTIYVIDQVIYIKLTESKIYHCISLIIEAFGVFAVILDGQASF